MSSTIITICSAVVGAAGVGYIVQGLRAGRGSAEGRGKVIQGAFLVLMVGSGVLPDRFNVVRDALVIAGCLVMLYSIVRRNRTGTEGLPGPV